MNFSQYSGIFVFVFFFLTFYLWFHKPMARKVIVRRETKNALFPVPSQQFPFLILKCPSENIGNDIFNTLIFKNFLGKHNHKFPTCLERLQNVTLRRAPVRPDWIHVCRLAETWILLETFSITFFVTWQRPSVCSCGLNRTKGYQR